jgi:hypothetical protein
MYAPARLLGLAALLVVGWAAATQAATEVVLGRRLLVRDPGDESRRRVVVEGYERPSALTIVGDPRIGGATVRIVAGGATLSDVTYTLPPSGWRATSTGFVYGGASGDGPVRRVVLRRSPRGSFRLRVSASGRGDGTPLDVVPPNPGTDGGVILTIEGGDTYCVSLGGAAGGTVLTEESLFRITRAAAEVGCPAFGAPERITINGYAMDAMEPFATRDGRFLLFNNSNAPPTDTNLHYAERIDDLTFDYRGEITGANSLSLDAVATVDSAGSLYFVSTRSYPTTLSTIYRGTFSDGVVSGVDLVGGISPLQPGIVNFDVEVSPDGESLFFVDGLFSGGPVPDEADFVIAEKDGGDFRRLTESSTLLAEINTSLLEYAAAISSNGRELFFTRLDPADLVRGPVIYRAARNGVDAPFVRPHPVATITGFVEAPTLSIDERSLYFHGREGSTFVIFRVAR